MRKLLVTGAGGFLGRHFLSSSTWLEREGVEVVAIRSAASTEPAPCRVVTVDRWSDLDALGAILLEEAPDALVNLAGLARGSFSELSRSNVELPERLLATAMELGKPVRLVLIGSAAEYGIPAACPLREDAPLDPVSPYGLSKCLQQQVVDYWCRAAPSLQVTVLRVFNLLGPGLGEHLAFGSFVRQILDLPEQGVLKVGNLEARRDFVAVGDAVRAIDHLLDAEALRSHYLLASGKSFKIGDLLAGLVEASGKQIRIEVDQSRLRGKDVPEIYGLPEALETQFSWRPEVSPPDCLRAMLDAASSEKAEAS